MARESGDSSVTGITVTIKFVLKRDMMMEKPRMKDERMEGRKDERTMNLLWICFKFVMSQFNLQQNVTYVW